MILEATDPRALKIAAREVCRELGLAERDRLVHVTREVGYYTNELPALEFTLRVNRREVDEEGNTIDLEARNRGKEAARFWGADGLVNLWELVAAIRGRAASLSVEVAFEVYYRSEIRLWQSQKRLEAGTASMDSETR